MNKLILILLLFLIVSFGYAQREKHGDYTATGLNEIVNTFTTLSNSVNAPSNNIVVNDNSMIGANFTSPLEAGDLLLIYQIQAGDVNVNSYPTTAWGSNYVVQNSWFSQPDQYVSNYIEFGEMLNYKNAGNFEFVEVLSISGTQNVTLTCPLAKNFVTGTNNKTIVVRIPRFNNLTIPSNTSITTSAWNGNTGGVVAIEVNGTLSITGNGEISADSTGFRGGVAVNDGATGNSVGSITDINSRGFLGSNTPSQGSEKGEGIAGGTIEYDALHTRYGYGAISNGGGGGGFHNAGGGGGANVGVGNYYGYGVADQGVSGAFNAAWNLEDPNIVTSPSAGGGRGGYSHVQNSNNPLTVGPHNAAWGSEFRRITGGVGGHPLTYSAERVFLGGGGGAGHGNDSYGGNGGAGGGAIFLQLYGDIIGNGTISANGGNGANAEGSQPGPFSTSKTGDDGAGGAGAGGAVFIKNINAIPSTINLEAKGGKGGDQVLKRGGFNSSNQADGPGGGGAGGLISYTLGTPTENVAGGVAGETNSSFMNSFPVNGATGGASGLASQTTTVFDIVITDDTICENQTVSLSAVVSGNLSPSPSLAWYDAEIGGNVLGFGATFVTPALSATTTYYAGTCPGTFRTPVTVVVAPQIVIAGTPPAISPETCAGNDGSITGLTATGGLGSLTFDWNGGSTTSEDLLNTVGGNYTLTVTDFAGCSVSAGPYTVASSPGPSIDVSNVLVTDESCFGNDGSISGITVSGGAAPLTYQWNGNVAANAQLSGVNSGTYTLVVTDNSGCSSTVGPFSVSTSNSISIDVSNISINSETCVGSDGSITGIVASGGTGTLNYNWSPGSMNSINLTSASSGNYTLTVTDGLGCSATSGPHTINQTGGPVVDVTNVLLSNETCSAANGSITGITATGNGLTYSWSPAGGNAIDASNLSSGVYTLTTTDLSGCDVSAGPYTISDSPGPVIDVTNIVLFDETCVGADASINGITFTGGEAPFGFTWNGVNSIDQDLSDTVGGSYTLVITDNNGCSDSAGPFALSSAPQILIDEVNMLIQDENCFGNNGSITGINVSGGAGTLTYSWSSGGNAVDLTNASSGTYTLTVTDALGCVETSGPHTINQVPAPTVDDANISIQDESCGTGNGSISGITAIGNGLSFSWSPFGGNAIDANNLSNGSYTLNITDAFGCTTTSGPYVVVNTPSPIIDISGMNINAENCLGNNGSITGITVSGGTIPYSYSWNGVIGSSPDFTNAFGGSYNFSVTDANGCAATAGPFTIPSFQIPTVEMLTPNQLITEGDTIIIQANVTPANANFYWSPPEGLNCSNCLAPSAAPAVSTWYTITAVSPDGCVETDSVFIEVQKPCGKVKVPTIFSPNGDGLNDVLCVLGNCLQSMTLQVFNRWGELVFETNEINACWDGNFKGKSVGTGVYIYKLQGIDITGASVNLTGNVNLMR
ncbi:T9SS type B sorting domain-containing protein [Brumimicrobium oceani]|uniref:Ig-like domain-containing protein n=1 Tax=Brumimicrobium oceani TaxID=2100725 RepID=A0A2U2XGA8_9FLAO|nr:gliding motility-associated C-terminal domain-containing protein [Brumimicrobium oceani]PWH86824.1 hypothetical protein DIT68_00755 [Brumimicrobium oceani]